MDPHRPRLPRHDASLAFESHGIGRRRRLHRRREADAAGRAHRGSPLVVGGNEHRERRDILQRRGDFPRAFGAAGEHDNPSQPAAFRQLEQFPALGISHVSEFRRGSRHQHLAHSLFERQSGEDPPGRFSGLLRTRGRRAEQ